MYTVKSEYPWFRRNAEGSQQKLLFLTTTPEHITRDYGRDNIDRNLEKIWNPVFRNYLWRRVGDDLIKTHFTLIICIFY